MENKGLGLVCYEPPKPTVAEIADYKHRKKVAEMLEEGLVAGCDLLRETILNFGREIDIGKLAQATRAIAEAARALPNLEAYRMPPYGYTEEQAAGEDAEG